MAFFTSRLKKCVQSAYSTHLLATNVIAGGGLLFLGDVLQQHIEIRNVIHETGAHFLI